MRRKIEMTVRFLDDVANFDSVVCDNVEWMFDGAEEIGSSDINACVNNVIQQLGFKVEEISTEEFMVAKFAVHNAISNLDWIRENH
jgi:hypothetical protein